MARDGLDLNAWIRYSIGMAKNTLRQYTIRNVPESLDRVLRQRARELHKSFNQVALEALLAGAGGLTLPRRDLSGIAGSLSEDEARQFDDEIRLQRRIDEELWR